MGQPDTLSQTLLTRRPLSRTSRWAAAAGNANLADL